MDVSQLPLNALRAFEASARLNSFTRAGLELHVSQTAVSHQIKTLEELLGVMLFKRLPRGVTLTDEGETLLPVLTDAFRRMSRMLTHFKNGNYREILTVGVVSTFALGWFLPLLDQFRTAHPEIELRLKTNNNKADFLGDGLDCFLRFGDGAWHGAAAENILTPRFSPICARETAKRIRVVEDLYEQPLLRSYRRDEWTVWFRAAGLEPPRLGGFMFDTSHALVEAAAMGVGVALIPVEMFRSSLSSGRVVQPFESTIDLGSYWLTWLNSRQETLAMKMFRTWIVQSSEAKKGATDQPPLDSSE
ncbi:MAG: LysR family transcriptional regulator [Roseibium sp.]